VSLCDVALTVNASDRMRAYLDENIREEHFHTMAAHGFNIVRLPLGYWNLMDIPQPQRGITITPTGDTKRLLALQSFMSAKDYDRWISDIFRFARGAGLQVLLDLHGAPGGQTNNSFTGCDQGNDNYFLHTSWNQELYVLTIEAMAKLCARHGDVCYGLELLNEPGDQLEREMLASLYERAILKARVHLPVDKTLVVMDWTRWLDWWKKHEPFSYGIHGRVAFATHVYQLADRHTQKSASQQVARESYAGDVSLIKDFFTDSKYDLFVTEYTLAGHGDGFDYTSFAAYMVNQFNSYAGGSFVWNFDSAPWMLPWGLASATKKPAKDEAWIDWKIVFEGPTQEDIASTVLVAENTTAVTGRRQLM
jgi:glucan 1,3-beta-glucosidase